MRYKDSSARWRLRQVVRSFAIKTAISHFQDNTPKSLELILLVFE